MLKALGDIAGIIAWENARKTSKHPEEFGKGSLEGLTAETHPARLHSAAASPRPWPWAFQEIR
jgi:TctA family transporter